MPKGCEISVTKRKPCHKAKDRAAEDLIYRIAFSRSLVLDKMRVITGTVAIAQGFLCYNGCKDTRI
jgi:hypothetical protein